MASAPKVSGFLCRKSPNPSYSNHLLLHLKYGRKQPTELARASCRAWEECNRQTFTMSLAKQDDDRANEMVLVQNKMHEISLAKIKRCEKNEMTWQEDDRRRERIGDPPKRRYRRFRKPKNDMLKVLAKRNLDVTENGPSENIMIEESESECECDDK